MNRNFRQVVRVIKAFNAEQQETEVFEKGVARCCFKNVKKSLTATAIMTSSSTFLVRYCIYWSYGDWWLLNNDSGDYDCWRFFINLHSYLAFMVAPIVQMSNIGSQLTEALAGLDRTEELMNMPAEEDDENRTIALESLSGNIKFDDVSFAYQEGKEVLNNISFEVPSGSVTALVGSSGSGKSTIAGLSATFLNPKSGQLPLIIKICLKYN